MESLRSKPLSERYEDFTLLSARPALERRRKSGVISAIVSGGPPGSPSSSFRRIYIDEYLVCQAQSFDAGTLFPLSVDSLSV